MENLGVVMIKIQIKKEQSETKSGFLFLSPFLRGDEIEI